MADTVVKSISRHLNCLKEGSKFTRKKAIEAISEETIKVDPSVLKTVLGEIIKEVLGSFSDPVEKCRELSVIYIRDCVQLIDDCNGVCTYLFPVLVQRLGQPDIVEPSEEVRLLLVNLLLLLITKCDRQIAPYVDDTVKILQRTIQDQYPDVKRASCLCARLLAKTVPQVFHMQSESLITPLLQQLTHQHSKVRSEIVITIGDVIQYGNGKSINDVVSHLAQRLFDQVPVVRSAVTDVVGKWLLDLPDRYSYHYKLIPLLLTSFFDDMPDIKKQAQDYWNDIGLKYEVENEEDLKDKINFQAPRQQHYPPNVERCNLGCRMLMYYNYSKIVKGIKNDVGDWVVDTRLKSSQLLYFLLLNEEGNVTQHLQDTLDCMYKACNDDSKEVVQSVIASAELIGYFVPPSYWAPIVLKHVGLSKTSPSCAGHVMILAAILRGSERSTLTEYVSDICEAMLDEDISNSVEPHLQHHLLACVESLVLVLQDGVSQISNKLFSVTVRVLALTKAPVISSQAGQLLEVLAECQGISRQQLFETHTMTMLGELKQNFMTWNQHSLERIIFNKLIEECGPVVGNILDAVIPVLAVNLDPTKDPEVRLKFFSLLSRLLLNSAETVDSEHRFSEFSSVVIKDMIIPNMLWKAGRTASTVRTAALSCLWAIIKSQSITAQELAQIQDPLMIQLWSTCDDDNVDTRLLTLRVLCHVMSLLTTSLDIDNKMYNAYPNLLKRLDDAVDDVRLATCQAFIVYFDCFQNGYEVQLYEAHLTEVYQGLLIHLNDPNDKIQQAVYEVLKKCATIKPTVLLKELNDVRHTHRTPKYCDKLAKHLEQMTLQ